MLRTKSIILTSKSENNLQTTKNLFVLKAQVIGLRTFFLVLLLFTITPYLNAQVQASGHGFNYFERQWVNVNEMGAGYSFYAAAWPIMQQYPGPENFQLGWGTWLSPLPTGNEPPGFYNRRRSGMVVRHKVCY